MASFRDQLIERWTPGIMSVFGLGLRLWVFIRYNVRYLDGTTRERHISAEWLARKLICNDDEIPFLVSTWRHTGHRMICKPAITSSCELSYNDVNFFCKHDFKCQQNAVQIQWCKHTNTSATIHRIPSFKVPIINSQTGWHSLLNLVAASRR